MPSLIDFSESECITYTIGRELNQLERLASSQHAFANAELTDLNRCLDRMRLIVSALAGNADDEPLPDWLQRKDNNKLAGNPGKSDQAKSV